LLRLVVVLSTLSVIASATPITWNLVGVTLLDGGTATGSFVFDADTTTYSSIDIVTTAGTEYAAETFTFLCTSPCDGITPDDDDMLLLTQTSSSDLTGTLAFGIFPPFDQPLTDGGGDIPLIGGTAEAYEALCVDSTCTGPTGFENDVVTGSLDVPEPSGLLDAPEPSGALLIASAALLFGVGRFRRRRT
jgi:hypothetical protein